MGGDSNRGPLVGVVAHLGSLRNRRLPASGTGFLRPGRSLTERKLAQPGRTKSSESCRNPVLRIVQPYAQIAWGGPAHKGALPEIGPLRRFGWWRFSRMSHICPHWQTLSLETCPVCRPGGRNSRVHGHGCMRATAQAGCCLILLTSAEKSTVMPNCDYSGFATLAVVDCRLAGCRHPHAHCRFQTAQTPARLRLASPQSGRPPMREAAPST